MKNKLKSVRRGSKSAAISQGKSKPSPTYPDPLDAEIARLGASLKGLTGTPFIAASKRFCDLWAAIIERDKARRLAAGAVTCVWTGPDGREFVRVDFERELFSLIEGAASKLGITLQQLFDDAVHHYCDLLDSRRAA
jgi:hypothetical protein